MIIYSNSNKEITAQEASQNVELKIVIGQDLDVMNSVVACTNITLIKLIQELVNAYLK